MKVIEPSFRITYPDPFDGVALLRHIERCGRVAWKSEHKITDTSYLDFARMIIAREHFSVFDHAVIGVVIVTDRGVLQELVRARIGVAFTVESTRFCNYSGDRFGNEVTFIRPPFWPSHPSPEEIDERYLTWWHAMQAAEDAYLRMLQLGATPQEARSVLPNSLKTEIAATLDITAWRLLFHRRTALEAHPQMRQVMRPLLAELRRRVPVVFDDVGQDGAGGCGQGNGIGL